MIIHESLVNKEMIKYYSKIQGNGELKEYDSLIDFLKTPSLVTYRDKTVKPLSKKEIEDKKRERIYTLVNMLR